MPVILFELMITKIYYVTFTSTGTETVIRSLKNYFFTRAVTHPFAVSDLMKTRDTKMDSSLFHIRSFPVTKLSNLKDFNRLQHTIIMVLKLER